MNKKRHHIFNTVLHTIRSHLILSLTLIFSIAGTVVTGILPPLVLAKMIDTLTSGHSIALTTILYYAVLLAVSGLFDASKEALITVFGQKVTHRVRSEMMLKSSRLPASYFVKNETGVIVSRFVNDVDTIETLFDSGIISMIADSCQVISILCVIFVKSRGLGILMLLTTPVLFLLTVTFQKRMKAAQIENRVAVGRSGSHIAESIRCIRMIHAFGIEKFMKRKYASYIDDCFDSMEKSNFYDAIYSPIIITISSVITAVMMVCAAMGGSMQSFFGMSVGTAVAVISYVGKVFDPLESIGMEIQNIQSAAAGIFRINEFLDEEERSIPAAPSPEFSMDRPAVEFCNVAFGYDPAKKILDSVNLSAAAGTRTMITGRTGIGKSTLFKLILGLYEPWSGEISIFGVPVKMLSDRKRASVTGYVEQSFHMIPGTVADQITLKDPSVSRDQVCRALKTVGLLDTVSAFENGPDTLCRPSLFSQGQLQLLSIARAIVSDPQILLLDEITANLDSSTEMNVLDALDRASENRTVLSVSHRVRQTDVSHDIDENRELNMV